MPHINTFNICNEKLLVLCMKKRKSEVKPSLFTSEFNMYKPYLWASHLLSTTNLCHPRVTHSQKAMRKRTAVISLDSLYQLGKVLDCPHSGPCQPCLRLPCLIAPPCLCPTQQLTCLGFVMPS